MIYLLIFIWITEPYDKSPQSAVVAEFNDAAACQAAAAAVRKQAEDRKYPSRLPLIMCAAKGSPKR